MKIRSGNNAHVSLWDELMKSGTPNIVTQFWKFITSTLADQLNAASKGFVSFSFSVFVMYCIYSPCCFVLFRLISCTLLNLFFSFSKSIFGIYICERIPKTSQNFPRIFKTSAHSL